MLLAVAVRLRAIRDPSKRITRTPHLRPRQVAIGMWGQRLVSLLTGKNRGNVRSRARWIRVKGVPKPQTASELRREANHREGMRNRESSLGSQGIAIPVMPPLLKVGGDGSGTPMDTVPPLRFRSSLLRAIWTSRRGAVRGRRKILSNRWQTLAGPLFAASTGLSVGERCSPEQPGA